MFLSIILFWIVPAKGQDSESLISQLEQRLNSFAKKYASARCIKVDSIRSQKKNMIIFVNEALEDIPFREDNVSELYENISPLFPDATKTVIQTRGTAIEKLIPEYYKEGRTDKKKLYRVKESKYPLTNNIITSEPESYTTEPTRLASSVSRSRRCRPRGNGRSLWNLSCAFSTLRQIKIYTRI